MGTKTFNSPFYPGQSRIVIDDLRGDALMQRISDLLDGTATAYTICRSINNTANVGVLVSYTRFRNLIALATGDKAPADEFEDVTDDFVIPNLNMIFDVINGNAQQSPASQNRVTRTGTRTEAVVVTAVNPGMTGVIDLGAPILPSPVGVTGSVQVTTVPGGAILVPSGISGAGGWVQVAGSTGTTVNVEFIQQTYKEYFIRRAASPFSMTGGVGATGAVPNRQAVLMNATQYAALLAVQP